MLDMLEGIDYRSIMMLDCINQNSKKNGIDHYGKNTCWIDRDGIDYKS